MICAHSLGQVAQSFSDRAVEIDRILTDARPRGPIRHSSLPVPTASLAWRLVLDQEPLNAADDGSRLAPINDPDAVLGLIHTSGTTGHPKGVVVIHANCRDARDA